MRTLAFDNITGLQLSSDKSLIILTDLNSLVSKIQQRLRFLFGEWFLNTTVGVTYFQQIFRKPVDPSLIVSVLNSEILKEPDVQTVTDSSIDFDQSNRIFNYSARVETTFGTTTLSEEVTI